MKNTRNRNKLLAAVALSIPVFVAAHAFVVDMARTENARVSKLSNDTAVPVPAHMSGSVVDLWVLWGLRHALVPSVVQAAGDASMNKAQQESQP